MPRNNDDSLIEVELAGGPLDGERVSLPRNQWRWFAPEERWPVLAMDGSALCYQIHRDGRMHYVGRERPPEDA